MSLNGSVPTSEHGAASSLYGMVSAGQLESSALFVLQGVLTRFRVSPIVDRDGQKRYVHNLTIYQAGTRKYFQCSMWDDSVIDLRPELGKPFSFCVTFLRASRDEKYGTVLGKGLPAVEFNGVVLPEVLEAFRSDIELEA